MAKRKDSVGPDEEVVAEGASKEAAKKTVKELVREVIQDGLSEHAKWYLEKKYLIGNPLEDEDGNELLPLGVLDSDGLPLRIVHIGKLTGVHEDVITSAKLTATGRQMNFLIAGGRLPGMGEEMPGLLLGVEGVDVITEDFVKELSSGDRAYILARARIKSYPENAEHLFRVRCEHCSQTYSWAQDLTEMNAYGVREADVGREEWEMILPDSKKKVLYKVLRGTDEKPLSVLQKKYGKGAKLGDYGSGFLTEIMRRQIVSIDGDERITTHALRSLSVWDRTFFRNESQRVAGGWETEIRTTCADCSGETLIDLPMGKDFFFPSWI